MISSSFIMTIMLQRHSRQPSPEARRGRNMMITVAQSQTTTEEVLVQRRSGPGPCVAETAGQMTADCAAVCCCCSFGLINLFYFCLIKLPTGLLLRSARKFRRRTRRCRRCATSVASCSCSTKTRKSALLYSIDEEEIDYMCLQGDRDRDRDQVGSSVLVLDFEPTKDDIEFSEEMWQNLMNSGFGRSLSRRYEQPAKFCST